jgi:hypothetical protein
MAYRTHLLVVGNRTIDSPELLAALRRRAEACPLRVTLLVATPWAEREAARERAEHAAGTLREAGIETEIELGDGDPVVAVREAWDPRRHDEVVVSTFDPSLSHWLRIDLAQRVERLCGCQVRHVVSYPRPTVPPPRPLQRERPDVMAGIASLLRTGRPQRV